MRKLAKSAALLLALSTSAALVGCTESYTLADVDCLASYWPEGQTNSFPVAIHQVKKSENGTLWVMPQTALAPEINNTWQVKDLFTNYQCEGDPQGLTAVTF